MVTDDDCYYHDAGKCKHDDSAGDQDDDKDDNDCFHNSARRNRGPSTRQPGSHEC